MLGGLIIAAVMALHGDTSALESSPDAGADGASSRSDVAGPLGSESVKPPVLKRSVEAIYPPAAEAAGITGSVELSIVIDERGAVGAVKVINPGPHPGFAPAAVAAVKQFQFVPAEIDGRAAAVEIGYRYDFVIHRRPAAVTAPKPISLTGRVLERGTREPVVAAAVEAAGVSADTDAGGRFVLRGLPSGTVRVRVVSPAHLEIGLDEIVEAGRVKDVEYRLTRRRYGSFEAVVRGARERREVAVHELRVDEIATVPGTQGDVLKVIQDLPGVARAPFGLGLLLVRGSASEDTKVYLDGLEIPLLFHFGALAAVVNSDGIAGLSFYPGNFAANYGNATGGTVEIQTREPKHVLHGAGHVDLYDGAVLVEGPVGEGSVLLSARRSWVDQALRAVLPAGTTVAPVFYDYQAKYTHALWGGQASVFMDGSSDSLAISSNTSGTQLSLDSLVRFHRLGARWQRGLARDWRNDLTLAFGFDGNTTDAVNAIKIATDVWSLNLRDTFTYRPSTRFSLELGTDSKLRYFSYDQSLPPQSAAGTTSGGFGGGGGGLAASPSQSSSASGGWASPGFFATASWAPTPRLHLQPGVRLDIDSRQTHDAVRVDPRLSVLYDLGPTTSVKAAIGRYSEPPQPQQLTKRFGNPDLGSQWAMHYSLGIQQKLPLGVDVDLTGYYKRVYGLITQTRLTDPTTGDALNLSNGGQARSYGLEVMARRQIARGFYGWLAYTLSRSEVLDDATVPSYQYGYHLYQYDQTHILTAIASYQTENNWTFGTRVRYVSGNPYTPFANAIFNADNGSYTCIDGDPNSGRAPAFFQADARIDRRFVYDKWSLTAYLDVQNVTNRGNVEARFANSNCKGYATLTGLPIFPTLGLRGEF
jgi:TonB family protein